jgi:uncharacterized membrane protein required for colicin V production
MIRTRLRRLKQRDTRRLVLTILGGKMLGIASLLGVVKGFTWFLDSAAGAAPLAQVVHQTNDIVSPINTVWVLVTAFLVFFMQAGLMALEAGFARSRETVNILMECVFDTCLCGVLYWAIGFAFQFGTGNGFIGHSNFFLHGITPHTERPAWRSWPSSSSSSPSPTPRRPSRRAPWWGARGSGRHPLQRVRLRVHLPDLRPLGLGAGWLAGQHHGLVQRLHPRCRLP